MVASPTWLSRGFTSLQRDGARATLRKAIAKLAPRTGAAPSARDTPSAREKSADGLAEFLGLSRDFAYQASRTALRDEIRSALAGCAPANGSPSEMEGYRTEAALRFWQTLEWVGEALAAQPETLEPSLLETGSNPYFLTILLRQRFPRLRHMGINYFESSRDIGSVVTQEVVDPRGRLTASSYLCADIERHGLQSLGPFDLCLFCEVLEHLPFDPAWALFNLVRQLKPGGRLILSTPNPARFENLRRLALHDGTKDDQISGYGIHGRHNREYTMAELIDLIRGTGLRVLRWRTLDAQPSEWSRSAEDLGYGEYLLLEAAADRAPTLYRPDWLYRSFPPGALARADSLAADARRA